MQSEGTSANRWKAAGSRFYNELRQSPSAGKKVHCLDLHPPTTLLDVDDAEGRPFLMAIW
jgi:hypothetical protein